MKNMPKSMRAASLVSCFMHLACSLYSLGFESTFHSWTIKNILKSTQTVLPLATFILVFPPPAHPQPCLGVCKILRCRFCTSPLVSGKSKLPKSNCQTAKIKNPVCYVGIPVCDVGIPVCDVDIIVYDVGVPVYDVEKINQFINRTCRRIHSSPRGVYS